MSSMPRANKLPRTVMAVHPHRHGESGPTISRVRIVEVAMGCFAAERRSSLAFARPRITSTTWPQPLEFLTPPRNIGGMLRSIRAIEGAATSAV